jgi:aryl-alcohol dehydrogenase-like predicted oxidoreductase
MGGAVETWGHVDDRESIAAIHTALDLGINLIDTAPTYGLGHAEEIVGKALRGRRGEAVIATQCGLLFPERRGDQPRRCLSGPNILKECELSLRRLQTDRIDLYQCHRPDPATPIRETMTALTHLWEQGDIGAIGLSNFSGEQVRAALEFGPVHAVQLPFSLLNARAANDLVPFCAEHGIAVFAYSPLARGLLTGKYRQEDTFDDLRAKDPEFQGNRYHRNLRLVEELRGIAAGYGKTPAQLALNWVATFPGITVAIFGAKRPSQVSENHDAMGWTLSAEDQHRIGVLVGGRSGG